MGITNDLKKLIEHGDWKIMADLFNKTRGKNITAGYVQKVVRGSRAANEGTAAAEILPFVEKYLKNKQEFRSKLEVS